MPKPLNGKNAEVILLPRRTEGVDGTNQDTFEGLSRTAIKTKWSRPVLTTSRPKTTECAAISTGRIQRCGKRLQAKLLPKYIASMNSLGRDAINLPVLTWLALDRVDEAKAEATAEKDLYEAISTWDDMGQL